MILQAVAIILGIVVLFLSYMAFGFLGLLSFIIFTIIVFYLLREDESDANQDLNEGGKEL